MLNNNLQQYRLNICDHHFSIHNSVLFQENAGAKRFFYNTGNNLAVVRIPYEHNIISQQRNVGIVECNKTACRRYFRIENLQFKIEPKIN